MIQQSTGITQKTLRDYVMDETEEQKQNEKLIQGVNNVTDGDFQADTQRFGSTSPASGSSESTGISGTTSTTGTSGGSSRGKVTPYGQSTGTQNPGVRPNERDGQTNDFEIY